MPAPAALLLDLDGTLLDTEPLHFEAHIRFLATVGITPTPEDLVGNIGKGDVTFYEDLMRTYGRNGDAAAWVAEKTRMLIGLYRERPVAANPGASELLDQAVSHGVRCMVVTSSERYLADAALLSSGLAPRLPQRVCSEDTERHKPHPDPYLFAARRLGVAPAACLAVEDSASGVAAARAAGCRVAGFPGHIAGEVLQRAGAQRLLRRLDELLPWQL